MAEVATEKEVSEAPAEQKETREEEEGAREVGRDGKSPEKETAGVLGEGRDEESGSDESEEEEEKEVEGESSRISSREDKMARLRELHRRRLEARQLNHREVVEEDRRSKLPANWEARQRRIEWEEEDEKARKEAVEAGEDYEKEKILKTSAAELERLEWKKNKKKNPDPGFSDYAQAQFRQYDRLTKNVKPDMAAYEEQKMEMGADFYPGANSLCHGGAGKVSKEGLERMTADLAKQVEKRSKFSRRRRHTEEHNVDYINDRNMRFNRKAARYYDKYTAEIKQNLERGTAI